MISRDTNAPRDDERLRKLIASMTRALYLGVTPVEAARRGELGYFSSWFTSPLAYNIYAELVEQEAANADPAAPAPPLAEPVPSASSPPPPPPPAPSTTPVPRRYVGALSTASFDRHRSVIPSLMKRPNAGESLRAETGGGGIGGSNGDGGDLLAAKVAEVMARVEAKRPRHEIGVISRIEFEATQQRNKDAEAKASLHVVTTTTTTTNSVDENASEQHQVSSAGGAAALIEKAPAALLQQLQQSMEQRFAPTSSVVGGIAQLCLVVVLEPVDFTITLTFARRRDPSIITDSLLEIYNNVGALGGTRSQSPTTAPPLNEEQMAGTANDKLAINFFSRFPELAIQCKSLDLSVCQSVFALAAMARAVFDSERSSATPQGELLRGFKYNDVLDAAMGDRSRLLYAMCRAAIVGVGGQRKQQLVADFFRNALHITLERVFALVEAARRAALSPHGACMRRLTFAERALLSVADRLARDRASI